jgi:transcriptional regulator with PAS, ATPase and Fis domain
MLEVFRKLQKVATTDISVLITGETGTGKELIAREIHRRSNRATGPFVTVNCGAIPENLMESEMFGHVKGAFTGAIASRTGKFQQADTGTLFLDEVGELTPQLQVKLLRAIQERVIYRVGENRPEKCDIRIVAATNRNLEEMIKTGEFREDLYYRLNVVNLWLPPLRERGDDVFIIGKALLSKYADEIGRGSGSRRRSRIADRPAREGEGRFPAPLRARGARAQQRQPHANRPRPRRRSPHHLPLPREGAKPAPERRRRDDRHGVTA